MVYSTVSYSLRLYCKPFYQAGHSIIRAWITSIAKKHCLPVLFSPKAMNRGINTRIWAKIHWGRYLKWSFLEIFGTAVPIPYRSSMYCTQECVQYDLILLNDFVPITFLISLTCSHINNTAIILFHTNSQYQHIDDIFIWSTTQNKFFYYLPSSFFHKHVVNSCIHRMYVSESFFKILQLTSKTLSNKPQLDFYFFSTLHFNIFLYYLLK